MKPGSKNITTEGNFNKKADSLISKFRDQEFKKAPPEIKPKPKPKSPHLQLRDAMRKQNDSLRKLPKNDPYHLPTFEDSPEGFKKMQKFYTFSKDNEKLRRLSALGKKLRKKYLN